MGIYDRDYYRNEGPSFLDSIWPSGLVCRWLIGINVAVFVLQLLTAPTGDVGGAQISSRGSVDGWVTQWFILDTDAVMKGEIWRLLTFAFLHANFSHIFFNMLFLWWFGSDLEQLYGRAEFLVVYLLSAFCGGVVYELWSLAQGTNGYCLGASGAVTMLLVLCALHFPHRTVLVFFLLPVPLWLLAVFNVVQDTSGLLSNTKTDVAVVVHLAGAAFAVGYYKMQINLVNSCSELLRWKHPHARTRLKIFDPAPPQEEPVAVSATSAPVVMDEHLEAKLDAVLEKIARTGKESLTQQEQQILIQAAQMYKRRRS